MTFASVAPQSESKVACKGGGHVLLACRATWSLGWGISVRPLSPFGHEPPGCWCRVKGQKLLLSCCCITSHRDNACYGVYRPGRTDFQEHSLLYYSMFHAVSYEVLQWCTNLIMYRVTHQIFCHSQLGLLKLLLRLTQKNKTKS